MITRCITRPMPVRGATIRATPGDLERLPAPVTSPALGTGPAALAAELLSRVRAELPVIGGLGEREQVLVSALLTGLRSARTRRAYAGDVAAWPGWPTGRPAGRVHVDLWPPSSSMTADGPPRSVRQRRFLRLSVIREVIAAPPSVVP